MIESAARAGAVEPRSSKSPFFTWDVPQKPLSVQVSLDVITRLDREVAGSFRSVTARGSEIGGLLLGRVIPGARPVVVVEDYQLIPCDYSRGPLYRLSDKDRERLQQAVRERSPAVMGFFRGNTRKGLSLDADDVALFKECFQDPHNVFLLVRPFASRRSVAGFFIWENGALHAESSALEFPFAVPDGPEPAAPPPEAAPAPAKPAVRAQVVPIAPRREPAPPPPPPPPVEEAAPPAPAPIPEPVLTEEVPPVATIQTAEEPVPETPPGRSRWIWIGAAAALAAVVLAGVLFYPGRNRPAPQAAPAGVDTTGLALRVERSAGQLVLTWNRDAESVKTATRAVLSIADGDRHEDVQLDLPQLRNGSVVYTPLTADVNFRLEVTSSNPARSQSEYVRVLGRPSAMPATVPQNPAAPADVAPGPLPPPETPPAGPAPAVWRPPEQSLAERLRPARPSELPEPPSLQVASGQPALPAGLSSSPRAPALPPAPPAPVRPATQQPQPKVGGEVREARVISRVAPVYPVVARQAHVQGIVQLEATIASDGSVRNVRVISGHALLRQAAADAVRQWKYSPTLLNGQAVEATTSVSISFGQ